MSMNSTATKTGFSLTELICVATVLGVLAALVAPRVIDQFVDGRRAACHTQQGEIELQATLWRRANGSYPLANLSNIGANSTYFPEGLPVCPVDGASYTIDTTTGRVTGHTH